MLELFKYFGAYITLIFLIYLIGKSVLSFFAYQKKALFIDLALELAIGTLSITTLFAVSQTKLVTSLGVFLLLFASVFFVQKDTPLLVGWSIAIQKLKTRFSFLELLLVSLPSFIYQAYYQFNFKNATGFNLPYSDIVFNAKVSEYIQLTGNESSWQISGFLGTGYPAVSPYHYFELWLNALVAKTFGLLHAVSLPGVIYPMVQAFFCVALLATFQVFRKKISFLSAAGICILVAFKGFYLSEFLTGIHYFWNSILDSPKLGFIYFYLAVSILSLLINERKWAIFFLLSLPIIYITTAPAILTASVILSAILWFTKPALRNDLQTVVISSFIVGIGLLGFYNVFGGGDTSVAFSKNQSIDFSYIKTAINIIGASTLQLAYLFFTFAILFALQIYRSKSNLYPRLFLFISIFIFTIAFISLGGWALIHNVSDAPQVFQNIGIPALNVLGAIFAVFVFARPANKWILGICSLIIISNAVHGFWFLHQKNGSASFFITESLFSDNYMQQIGQALQENESLNPIGVSLFDSLDYVQGNSYYINHPFSVNTNTSVLGAQLKLIKPYFNTLCISPHQIPMNYSVYAEDAKKGALFYRYVEELKSKGRFESIVQAQLAFIKEKNIGYMILSRNATLLDDFNPFIKQSILDETSGEKFILLHQIP